MPGSDDRPGTSPRAASPLSLLAGSISNFLTVIDLGGENIEKIVKKILSDTLLHYTAHELSLAEKYNSAGSKQNEKHQSELAVQLADHHIHIIPSPDSPLMIASVWKDVSAHPAEQTVGSLS